MEDELEFITIDKVWDLETIPKGAKTIGYKWVYKPSMTPKGMEKDTRIDLWTKGSHIEKALIIMKPSHLS